MNKNRLIIIVVCVLLLACLMLFVKPYLAKMAFNDKAFAVKDTEKITKIILTNTDGDTSILTKENNVWIINHQYKTRDKVIQGLLHVMKNVKADYPVSKSGHNNVMKGFLEFSTRVAIYTDDDKPDKVYYVGGSNVTGDGTFMIMEKNGKLSDRPYVGKVLGMSGTIIPYYIADPKPWRSRELFAYKPADIKSISIQYPEIMDASFLIDNSAALPTIQSFTDNTKLNSLKADSARLHEYISYYEQTFAENYVNEYDQIDTLRQTTPYCIMQITSKDNKVNKLNIYRQPTTERTKTQFDPMGNKVQYDSDKFIALVNDGKDFALIQYYVFGKYFKLYEQFFNVPFEQATIK